MDESEIRRTFSGFSGVWERVSGRGEEEPAPARPAGGIDLRRLIRSELENAAALYSLARCTRGCSRGTLLELAAGARQRSRRLRGEYFIRKGEDYCPETKGEGVDDCREALRKLMQDQNELAEQYETAAAEARGELRQALQTMQNQNLAGAEILRGMILGSFGV